MSWVNKEVILNVDVKDATNKNILVPKGMHGLVTAELPDKNVYVVYFENKQHITFAYADKEHVTSLME